MNILICDDEQKHLDILTTYIRDYMTAKAVNFTIDAVLDPQKIINSKQIYQLVFLDIQINEFNGIELSKILKERNNKVVIFFVTAYNGYQDDAMDVRAFRFFEKPIIPERLYSGLEKAMEYIDETYFDFYLYTNNEHIKMPIDDICYVLRENRKTFVITVNGTFQTKDSFDDLANRLQCSFFYKIHKSFIINLHYVTKYKYNELYINNTRIPIASRRQADFHKFWFMYVKRR